jgi:hypothetical protein
MKKFFMPALLMLAAAGCFASIFEVTGSSLPFLMADPCAISKGEINARLNGKDIKITRFKSAKRAEQILDRYYRQAGKNNYTVTENFYVYSLAEYLVRAGFGETDYWDYICYEDAPGKGVLIAACDIRSGSGVIKACFDEKIDFENFKGFKDGIRHPPGVKMYLSIEFLSGKNTMNFMNFYRAQGSNKQMLEVYYEDMLKKDRWSIVSGGTSGDGDYYFIQKGKQNRLLGIFRGENSEEWVTVMG